MLSKSLLVQQDGLPIWRRQRRWQDQMEGDGERGAGGHSTVVQCIQKFFSQTLFDFKRMVSHSISPKLSGKIPYVLSKPRICFLGSKDKTVLF